jgi:sugar phosphate isomerase/epimerase
MDAPKSYDDMLALRDKLKPKGIKVFAHPGKVINLWPVWFFTTFAQTSGNKGAERTIEILTGNAKFTDARDPSHLIRVGVEVYPAYNWVKDRVKIIHAKDASIDATRLREVGYHGAGWWRYRLPGRGALGWLIPKALLADS